MIEAKHHPADMLVEWAAPAILAAAAGWAAWVLAGSLISGTAAAACGLAIGLAAMRLFGTSRREVAGSAFEPVPFDGCVDDTDELLLDDPLADVESDSRVVRLFEREDATPGQLVARIADYLGNEHRLSALAAVEGSASPPDASAALHAALANIRASLR
jgi:hypothetical protein